MLPISHKSALMIVLLWVLTGPAYAQTGAFTSNSQQIKTMSPADKATAERVNAALRSDRESYYRHVTVTAQNGVVTLGGFVTGDASRAKAKQIAGGVQGVSKVVDQMGLQPRGESNGSG